MDSIFEQVKKEYLHNCKSIGLDLVPQMMLLVELRKLDDSINNCTIEICQSIDNLGRRY